ncbi:MAG: hypothetical protein Q9170_004275 [Blastenia crenularia]
MLSSDYGREKVKPKAFSSLLASCSVPASKYPYTYTTTPTASTTIATSPPGTTSYTASKLNVTTATISSMFPGPYTTGGAVLTSAPPYNTTWYNTQTNFTAPPATTYTVNYTAASAVEARASYCPLTENDILNGWTIYDLPDACAPLLDPYCKPDPDKPIPTSTLFPAVCTPDRATATSSAPPTNAVPTPLEPSTVSSCKTYYKVLDGDNCYSIANNFKITTAQVCFAHSKYPYPISRYGIRFAWHGCKATLPRKLNAIHR